MSAMDNISNVTVTWTWIPVAWTWWQILQLILAILGILGNSLVMLVVAQPRRKRSSTDTLVTGLAAADLATSCFLIPHPSIETLPRSLAAQLYCRVIHSSLFMWISIVASIFTLIGFSIERLVAVRRPYLFKKIFTYKKTTRMIACIWLASVLVNSVVMVVVYYEDNHCVFAYPSKTFQKFVGVAVFLVEYLFPVLIMVVAYVLTIRALKPNAPVSTVSGNIAKRRTQPDTKILEARRRVIEMLLIVVITFIVCWTPDQFYYLILNLDLLDASYLYSPLYRSFVLLAFVNSCANPVIYASRNPNFRQAVKELGLTVNASRIQTVFADVDKDDSSGNHSRRKNPSGEMDMTAI